MNQSPLERDFDAVREILSPRLVNFKPFDFASPIAPRKVITINGVRAFAKGFLSVTGAAGGVGKSSLAIIEELSMALGVDLFDPDRKALKCGRQRVWAMSLEDDEDEHRRRVLAAIGHYRIDPADLDGWYFVTYKNDSPIDVAKIDKIDGFIVSPQVKEIDEIIQDQKIDVITVDPFVNTHACPENDNPVMNKVADIWRTLAQTNSVAIMLTHHIRKTSGEITADDLRGAVSLIGAARLVRVLAPMSQDEASKFSINPNRHRYYFWINPTAKANICPPAEKRTWCHLKSVSLNNGDDLWDEDVIGVVEGWEPPNVLDGVTGRDVQQLVSRMGTQSDEFLIAHCRYSPQTSAWIGNLIGEILSIDSKEGRAKLSAIIKAWVDAKVLVKSVVKGTDRKDRPVYRLGKAAVMGDPEL